MTFQINSFILMYTYTPATSKPTLVAISTNQTRNCTPQHIRFLLVKSYAICALVLSQEKSPWSCTQNHYKIRIWFKKIRNLLFFFEIAVSTPNTKLSLLKTTIWKNFEKNIGNSWATPLINFWVTILCHFYPSLPTSIQKNLLIYHYQTYSN